MNKTIVWIEDDVNIIWPLVRQLERAGYDVKPIESVHEAEKQVDLLRNATLILLDMILAPGPANQGYGMYPGKHLLVNLREKHHITTPVIILTVVTSDAIEQLDNYNVVDVIHKPVRPSVLKERVEKALENIANKVR